MEVLSDVRSKDGGDNMTKREFLDTVFALAPNEANAIMDAFDEYVDSNEPHWIPVTERLPETTGEYLVTKREMYTHRLIVDIAMYFVNDRWHKADPVIAWMPLPEPYKGVTE